MWYIYTIKYYSAVKNDIMKFAGKWREQKIILREVTQTQKEKMWYVFIYK